MKTVKKYPNWSVVFEYAESIRDGTKIACPEDVQKVERFYRDLDNPLWEFKPHDAELVIGLIEHTIVHQQGEAIDATPMQGKPFLLEPFQKFHIYNILGFYKTGTIERRYKEAYIEIPRKNAKALSLDTELPTPNGWSTIGDIRVGDMVFGKSGQPAKVIAKSEVFYGNDVFVVEFEDGAKVEADAGHLWTVQTKQSRRNAKAGQKKFKQYEIDENGYFTLTTADMLESIYLERKDGKGREYTYRVPMNSAVDFEESELLIDPYVLGVWLGDGTSSSATLTVGNQDIEEIISLVKKAGYECRVKKYNESTNTVQLFNRKSLTHCRRGHKKTDGQKRCSVCNAATGVARKNGDALPVNDLEFSNIKAQLRSIGVLNNKHIPEAYMNGSIDQRMALLQGLMDSDGTVSKAGQCVFTQVNNVLAKQVKELLASLGIKSNMKECKVTCQGYEGVATKVSFFTDIDLPCFRLERKLGRLKRQLSSRMQSKSITSIQKTDSKPVQCIAVDSSDRLFLFGRDYTATHNTTFSAALAWALAILERKSGSKVYIVAAALKQSLESWNFIKFNIKHMGEGDNFRVIDNNNEHSISGSFPDGSLYIQALAANPDRQDSLNCNIAIADELHAYKSYKQYSIIKEAMKAYTNKLMIGITTAGDNMNSFGYQRRQYCKKILDGTVTDDAYYVSVSKAPESERGEVDYLDPKIHEMANPMYGVTIRPNDIMNDARQAQNDPQSRKDFLAKSLNVYTAALNAYFDVKTFQASDKLAGERLGFKRNWSLEKKLKHAVSLNLTWYGGTDLSKLHDLTGASLTAKAEDGTILTLTHAWFPIVYAHQKADEDGIPLFGWRDDGWLTMSNSPTVNYAEVVNWYTAMKKFGFKIKLVGHDRRFAKEYVEMMEAARFKVADQRQYDWVKAEGFRQIDTAVRNDKLYYFGSEAYEYCVGNVRSIESLDEKMKYEKVEENARIDLFDCSVFGVCQMNDDLENLAKQRKWL